MSDAPDLTPQEAVDRWLRNRKPGVTDQTLSTFRYRLKLFVDWCEREGIDEINDIGGWDVDEYQLERADEAKKITLNKELGTLRQFLEYCHNIGLVEETVPKAVEQPSVTKQDRVREVKLDSVEAEGLLAHFRTAPSQRATRGHALLEVLWHVGCRVGGVHSLDVRDFDADEQFLRFEHRPETGTTLKKGLDGERYVGLLDEPTRMLQAYLEHAREDISDEYGRQPLFPSREGRPQKATLRNWTGLATVPCAHRECPHGNQPQSCEWLSQSKVSQCPSSRAPHHVRSGSITWQLSRGVPIEVVAKRVNASVDTIETYYDQEDPRRELEHRRRTHLSNLQLDNNE